MSASSAPDPAVHIVVTCTNRKRAETPPHRQFRNIRKAPIKGAAKLWFERLSEAPADERIPATDMYAGEHWMVAKNLATVGATTKLWICSAGYGLIPVEAPIAPYAATFAKGQPDSVANSTDQSRVWWRLLSEWQGPLAGSPRSFTELAAMDPRSTVIAVLSEPYLRSCADDLSAAEQVLESPDGLSVIGPKGRCAEIEHLVVPIMADLVPAVGGSLLSLNVRAARLAMQHCVEHNAVPLRSTLLRFMSEATRSAPQVARKKAGTRMSDSDVRTFIRENLPKGFTSPTPLLRILRGSDRSCEQSRFRRLFLEEYAARKEALNAS